jgi:drug/metabolite transporter (DMT)-like permease
MNAPPVEKRTGLAIALALGVAAVSSAAILISFARAQGVPALSIAALRMAIAALVVAPVALLRCRAEIRDLPVRDVGLGVASGIFLAMHFGFWTSSLDSTSVMSSVVFVSTNPLFVVAASTLLFREKLRPATLVGDIMALLGAVSASGYLLVGRRLRTRMSLPLYVGISYVTAASALLCIAGLTGVRLTGYPARGYMWILFLAVGPQLLGHTSYNYALKYVSATFVAVTLLGEPIGATLLAIPLLAQVPSAFRIVGGMFVLAGIFLSARAEAGSKRERAPEK